MKLFAITSLTVLIVLISAGMVNANGSQNSSSYKGVTISVAADVAEGQLTLSGINETGRELKLLVNKYQEGSKDSWYDVTGDYEISANVIFEDGIGKYFIYAMIQEDGDKYSYGPCLFVENIGQVQQEALSYIQPIATNNIIPAENTVIDSEEAVPIENTTVIRDSSFTSPGKDIDSDNEKVVQLSSSLTSQKKTEKQKIEAVYKWVAENITYDFDKYNNMVAGNYTDRFGSLSALETGKGVCYDMSTLLAALCRAAGIEAKVSKGYSTNIVGYHAWNEVFDSQNSDWIILDVTIESLKYHRGNGSVEFTERTSGEYSKTEEM